MLEKWGKGYLGLGSQEIEETEEIEVFVVWLVASAAVEYFVDFVLGHY